VVASASVEWVDSLPSTNAELARRVARGEALAVGHVLAAREQTAGRGRLERIWTSGAGSDLTFSLFWSSEPPIRMVSLPRTLALGVVELLAGFGIEAHTKWPNDVLVDGSKICGLLAECVADAAGDPAGVVVGVGLNINMSAAEAAAIGRPVTSIQLLTATEPSPAAVLERLIPLLWRRLAQWQRGGFEALRPEWERHAVWRDHPVEVQTETGPLCGILRGYGSSGQLLLESDGRVEEIWSAELLRPL